MPLLRLDEDPGQLVLHAQGVVCTSTREVVESEAFARLVALYLAHLAAHDAPLLDALGIDGGSAAARAALVDLLRLLAHNPLERIVRASPEHAPLLERRPALHRFVEGLYDFWRSFDRFLVDHAAAGTGARDGTAYRVFNASLEALAALVRDLYRDVAENVTGAHPFVYRQVHAGAELGVIVAPRRWPAAVEHRALLGGIPFVTRVLMYPPLILDPPANTRSGSFTEVTDDPLAGMRLDPDRWLCYPAVVGRLVIFVYVEQRFVGLGLSLANLFELADDEQVAGGPDAVLLFGAPADALARFGGRPTVFFDDTAHGLLVGALPLDDGFAYFGYLKKMILTLHNVAAMKRGLMPYHGAFTRLVLPGGAGAGVLLIGDTATGKSETLEALRLVAGDRVAELRIVADDMGALEVAEHEGRTLLLGYGTEIGAFVRLDDLQQGYAIGQIDRAIIMSPQKVNARVVLPVTTLDEVQRGYPVDVLLYANNFEPVDDDHPIVQRFADSDAALAVFREGRALSRGTTASSGLVASYFANIFGPAQRPAQHDALAERTFAAAYAGGVFVGQLRTRLGLPGFAHEGPRAAAAALLELIAHIAKGEARK
ncbi:MAG: hypothetical protein ABR941_09690 [Thermoleophilia bacterium]